MTANQSTATLLRSHGLRVTPQRRAILAAFEPDKASHLSADEVLQRARRELPELSRATVYNALNEFVAAGLLRTVEGRGSQLYDANVDGHHHFRCRSCNRLYDVQPAGVNRLRLHNDGFLVEDTQITFEGFCPTCTAPRARSRPERPAINGTDPSQPQSRSPETP